MKTKKKKSKLKKRARFEFSDDDAEDEVAAKKGRVYQSSGESLALVKVDLGLN